MIQAKKTSAYWLSLLGLAVAAVPLAAGEPQKIVLAEPGSALSSRFVSGPTRIGDRLYFSAYDPLYGFELWESDGTANGSRRLTDLCPGACSGYFDHLTALGDRIYFTVSQGSNNALYTLEGDQPVLVTRFSGFLTDVEAFDQQLFLQVTTSTPHSEELIYRLTPSGELAVFDQLCPPQGTNCSFTRLTVAQGSLYYLKFGELQRVAPGGGTTSLLTADNFVVLGSFSGGRFLFRACSGNSCRLYSSDGTVAGTAALLPANSLTEALFFTEWNGLIYWITTQRQLVRSDGTSAGTVALPGILADSIAGATPRHLFFHRAVANETDLHLLALAADGSTTEVLTFTDFHPEVVGVLGNSFFFTNNHLTLYVSNGTPAGTRALSDLIVPSYDLRSSVLFGRLYASAYPSSGAPFTTDLWRFDETGDGEVVLGAQNLPVDEAALPFALGDSVIAGDPAKPAALWRIDPQSRLATLLDLPPLSPSRVSGDRMLAKADNPPDANLLYGITPTTAEELPHRFRFTTASSGDGSFYWGEAALGQKLWTSDATLAGTRELFDFSPNWMQPPGCGPHCLPEAPSSLLVAGDRLYFLAAASPEVSAPPAFWVWQRSTGQKTLLKVLDPAYSSQSLSLVAVGNQVAFLLAEPAAERGLWATDGTVAGTRRFRAEPDTESLPSWLGSLGSKVFFLAQGHQLWSSDLTPAGTGLLFDRPDWSASGTGVAAGGLFFFAADSFDLGPELWTSDGTAAGTRPLDLRPGPFGSWPSSLLAVGGRVVFAADDGKRGHELWQSDGTLAGTRLVADLAPGKTPSSPIGLTAIGQQLFFSANDGTTGRGVWSLELPGLEEGCPTDRLCLQGDRFVVKVVGEAPTLFTGQRVLASNDSGVFSFFSPTNWEMLVKVLDGCAINQRYWVYAAAATDVAWNLTVEDLATGVVRTYRNPFGPASPAIPDSAAFATCP